MEENVISASKYESAIRALNGLQSNIATLNLLRQRRQSRPDMNLMETEQYIERIGIRVTDLDRLNIIHVAGTKGKGSVCAMAESILRNHGLKTGFYSSPHLIHVRERIRINGEPLSEEKFALHFWSVYDRLLETKAPLEFPAAKYTLLHFKKMKHIEENLQSMPAYFKFLTIMSFHVFLAEKVDVAIVEVGIGGTYDCTNVIQRPVVCGITTLDYDHTGILGDTIEQIAWQKAGIMKSKSVAVTMDQFPAALGVLAQRSDELNCPLYMCPPLTSYDVSKFGIPELKVGIPGRQQLENASLALQLTRMWFRRRDDASFLPEAIDYKNAIDSLTIPILVPFPLSSIQLQALRSCRWPGRSQTLERGTTTFFIDGAHTPKSMEFCAEWFNDAAAQLSDSRDNVIRVLIFNCTSDRKPETLLKYLVNSDFDCAIFCPNMIFTEVDAKSDLANMRVTHEKAMERCEESRKMWLSLQAEDVDRANGHNAIDDHNGYRAATALRNSRDGDDAGGMLRTRFANAVDWHHHLPDASLEFANFDYWTRSNGVCPSSHQVTAVFPCISSALRWVDSLEKTLKTSPEKRLQVLVTGSLHLVGGVLSILDPDLSK